MQTINTIIRKICTDQENVCTFYTPVIDGSNYGMAQCVCLSISTLWGRYQAWYEYNPNEKRKVKNKFTWIKQDRNDTNEARIVFNHHRRVV